MTKASWRYEVPVLVEGLSVVIKASRVLEAYQGDFDAFKAHVPNDTLCADGELVRVGFLSPLETRQFVENLADVGLCYVVDGNARDLTVIDQRRGPCAPTPWLEIGTMSVGGDSAKRVGACRLAGGSEKQFVTPDMWEYSASLTTSHLFLPTVGDRSE